jgi:hypothetical protein
VTVHPRVAQLRFTRREWLRGLEGVTEEDARRRVLPMNSIGWIVGHLAWQEQRYWLMHAQGITLVPHLDELVGFGRPASTPPLGEMLDAWQTVTSAADPFLDALTTEALLRPMLVNGTPQQYSVGSRLQRMLYHYWFHIGEIQAIRQVLGHSGLQDFVGDVETEAPYQAEQDERH